MVVMVVDLLRKVGLNKYETEAYLALLNKGPSTAFMISKNGGVPYGRVYDSLNELIRKGFVEVVPSKPKKYSAVNPETAIRGYLDEQSNSLEKLRAESVEVISSFKKRKSSEAEVTVDTGKKNFAKAVVEHFKYKEDFWATSENFLLEKNYPALRRYVRIGPSRRYVLIDINKADKARIKEVIKEGLNVKHYVLENVRFLVSDEELVTISIQEKDAEWVNIHVQNKSLGKALTKIMKLIWKNSKKV